MESNQPPPPTEDLPGANKTERLDLNRPCRISNVQIEGARKTRPSLIAKIVADVFNSHSILEFLEKSILIRSKLSSLGAFSSVDIEVNPVDENDPDNYEVTFVVEERGRLTASAQTAVDSHSTHLNLQLSLPNLNGIGDSIQFNGKFNKRMYSGECRYSVPIAPWKNLWAPTYSLAYSQYQWDALTSGIDQEDKSIINQVDFYSLPQLHHTISFENIWRYIKSSSSATPVEIREQCGHSVKSSVKHTLTWDTRVGGNFPFEGVLAKLSNEFTTNLVSNSARFTRHEADLQLNTLILPKYDLLCQVNLLAGTLIRPKKINICDKFFAGGPLTLRGFRFQGLEPNVGGFPLGDASYMSAGLHIYSILPYTTPDSKWNEYVRPHLFFNTGTIGELPNLLRLVTNRENIKREAVRFKESLRYSCGFGLVMIFMKLRFEVNYCIPLIFKEKDLSMRGIQWGFGLSYT